MSRMSVASNYSADEDEASVQLNDFTSTEARHLRAWGIAINPSEPNEVLKQFVGGGESLSVVTQIEGNYYPQIDKDEMCFFTPLDEDKPHRVHLKKDHSISIEAENSILEMKKDSVKITVGGVTLEVTPSGITASAPIVADGIHSTNHTHIHGSDKTTGAQ